MPDFFRNKKVASAVVERVPCSFAKANADGSSGTHYTVVLLDHYHNVLYVGSECEHVHGEGIQAVHELGGGTCFAVTEAFQKSINKIKSARSVVNMASPAQDLPPLMHAAMQFVWSHAADRHNERVTSQPPDENTRDRRLHGLQSAVDRVATSVLSIAPANVLGRNHDKVVHHNVSYARYKTIFNVNVMMLIKHDRLLEIASLQDTPGTYIVMRPKRDAYQSDAPIFALRNHDGAWVVFEDEVKRWAAYEHTVFKEKQGLPRHKCIFCADEFERMPRHTQGAKHIDRVLELVKLTCKATSKNGLRMLNNPRHRSMFLKPR